MKTSNEKNVAPKTGFKPAPMAFNPTDCARCY